MVALSRDNLMARLRHLWWFTPLAVEVVLS